MDGDVKSNKYLMNQPASVHSYTKLSKSESPRTHTSPTSILRKFPHSLRHDQKHQTKIKRNSSPVVHGDAGRIGRRVDRDAKSWCLGDESEVVFDPVGERRDVQIASVTAEGGKTFRESPSGVVNRCVSDFKSVHELHDAPENADSQLRDVVSRQRCGKEFTSPEPQQRHKNDRLRIGSIKKLSVINNSLNEYKKINEKFWYNSVDKISEFNNKIPSPVHKSTPNLLRSEPFGVPGAVSHPERIADRLSRVESFNGEGAFRDEAYHNQQVPLKGCDSLPQLNNKYRIIRSILPKINRTISESHESLSSPRKAALSRGCVKSDSHINANLFLNAVARSDSCRLPDLYPIQPRILKLNGDGSDEEQEEEEEEEESERIGLIDDSGLVLTPEDRQQVKNRWSGKRTVEIMPSLKNLVTRKNRGGGTGKSSSDLPPSNVSIPLVTTPPSPTARSGCSLNSPVIRDRVDGEEDGLHLGRCDMMHALTDLFRTQSSLQIEPMKPINRLRVPPNPFGGSLSRMCSRCSSLLSMASSSRYSINTTGSGFVPCSPTSEKAPEPLTLCKLCLLEVPLSQSMEINQCGCVFCRDCMRLYVEFEIQEGAYDISCPDAQCHKQGTVTVNEVELLVTAQMMERYMRFRLNHEVDLDRNRTWCPRAGCETVCNICPREKCSPTSVHCPTCDSDFCSNCKNPWHRGLTCEENSKKLAREGHTDFMESGIPFDSDLIKCCPMCNVPIEKDEGCAQMMCKRCKHVFCWYCLASLDDDFLLRHYDKGPCKNKLGHSRASVIWHRTQVIGIFAGFGILLLVASPLLLVAAPCIVCCKCRVCSGTKMDPDDDLPEESGT